MATKKSAPKKSSKAAPKKAVAKKAAAPKKKAAAQKKAVASKPAANKAAPKHTRPKADEMPPITTEEPTRDEDAARMDALRSLLGRKREELIKTIHTEVSKYIKGEDRQMVESALDDGDWSVFDLNEDLKIKKLSSYRQSLIKVDDSIRKLEEGTYGVCEDCGEEISSERLRILPFAIRCRDCQEEQEELEAADRGESMAFPSSTGSED